MNSDYIFFYSQKAIKYFNLKGEFTIDNLKTTRFIIDEADTAVIREIRTTNKSGTIIIDI